jgi:hypothetical protein
VKLQLNNNQINNLDWMKDRKFPNMQILNLSHNFLKEIDLIAQSCSGLIHLQLSGNPLPEQTLVLSPIRLLEKLSTLDCSACPVSNHPEYSTYVAKYLTSVQVSSWAGLVAISRYIVSGAPANYKYESFL